MILANKAVSNFLKRYPSLGYLRKDLQSAAKLGLMDGINRCSDDAALMKRIKGAISDTVQELSDGLPIPKSSKRLARKNGIEINPEFVDRLPAGFDIVDDRGSTLLTQVLECCRDDQERTIVRMLAGNWAQREIAEHLKLDFRRVSEAVAIIKRRFDDDEDGSDEPYTKTKQGTNGHCRCGQSVARWTNATTCESCYAEDAQKFHGRSQRAKYVA